MMQADESPMITNIIIDRLPRHVGGYDIGGITFMLTRRPHWIARFLCRWLLDWRWILPSGKGG